MPFSDWVRLEQLRHLFSKPVALALCAKGVDITERQPLTVRIDDAEVIATNSTVVRFRAFAEPVTVDGWALYDGAGRQMMTHALDAKVFESFEEAVWRPGAIRIGG